MSKKLVVLLLSAFLIRLIALNQSLWLDEAISVSVASNLSYHEIATSFSPHDFHPPLYYWILRLWVTFFGRSEVAVRLPSVIFSLLAGYAVFRAGKLIKNEGLGWWSAAFFLCNPLLVYYSQEARMYLLATMLIAFNLWSYLELQKRWEKKWLISFSATLIFSFFSFYGSIFYFIALGLHSLWRRQWRFVWLIALSAGIAVLVVGPLLFSQWLYSREVVKTVPNWHSVLGSANIKNLLLVPVKLTSGRISFEPKLLYYCLASIWAALLAVAAFLGRKEKTFTWLLTVPVVVGFIFSFVSPMLQYFRFIYLILPLSILLAVGLYSHFTLRKIILGGFVVWSLVYVLLPQFHREDWRELTRRLHDTTRPIYMVPSAKDPLQYYAPNLSIRSLATLDMQPPAEDRVVVIPYVADVHGIAYHSSLASQGYQQIESITVRGVMAEVWRRSE